DRRLPITTEVGGEGGSYADATLRQATFDGDTPRLDHRASSTSQSPPASEGGSAADIIEGGPHLVRHASDPPQAQSARESRRTGRWTWQRKLIAGFAGALAVGLVRRFRA
ncbi:MAG TPA: hypothetical protein VD833_22395, partial [Vicinamibacterales bacterium]|nr:hypothetical protein [Vicinamibacterales bacterium]